MGTKSMPDNTEPELLSTDQEWKLSAVLDVLDKQYRLYSWNDEKTMALITTDSVLFAAIGFLFPICLKNNIALLSLMLALLFLGLSLWSSLQQVIPQGSSGKSGKNLNIRTLRGIAGYSSWREYTNAFLEQNQVGYLQDCTRQIYGMTINNDISREITRKGVKLTLAGVAFIILAAFVVAVDSKIPEFKKWLNIEKSIVIEKPSKETPSVVEVLPNK